MATVLLLRHGRTSANAEGVLAGWSDVDLDETGQQQVKAAAERLRDVPLSAVLTSPLRRCRQTVDTVLEARPGLTAVADERLGECRYGDWEGQRLEQLAADPLWQVVQRHPAAAVFPGAGGESMAAAAARAVEAIRQTDSRIDAEHGAGATWLACSHGDVIKAIVADAIGVHLDLFQRIVVDPGSVSAIRYTPFRPFLMRLNDTGGDLAGLVRPAPPGVAEGDAAVGGGAPAAANLPGEEVSGAAE